jgi:hypothetical protein
MTQEYLEILADAAVAWHRTVREDKMEGDTHEWVRLMHAIAAYRSSPNLYALDLYYKKMEGK